MSRLFQMCLYKTVEYLLLLFLNKGIFSSCCECLSDIPSVFPSRLIPPGLNSQEKAWWAKEITPDFHVCGRLSDRQIKYASEAGFKSILSLFTYPTGDPPGSFGGDYLPITDAEKVLVEEVAQLQFVALLDPMDEWASVEAVEKFTAIVPHLKKPSLLHCDRGYTIAFVALLYMANQTIHNSDFEPKIRSKEIYEISAKMGLDFLSRIPMEVVSEVTGEPIPNINDPSLPRPIFKNDEWLDYWFAHPVHTNWFIAGQIMKSHLAPLKEFGYKSVINLRSDKQNEVNLLNIKDKTTSEKMPRQSEARLLETRIDPSRPNTYISEESETNYESINEHEFGDSSGYNEELERKAFKDSGLEYYHVPLGDVQSTFAEFIDENIDGLLDISANGPVLVHCSCASRAGLVAVLSAGIENNLSLNWALQQLKEMGMGISNESHPQIFKVYKKYLSKNSKEEL